MTNPNPLTLASVNDIKALVTAGVATHADALARVDAVLARSTLKETKKARWVRLREWIVKESEKV